MSYDDSHKSFRNEHIVVERFISGHSTDTGSQQITSGVSNNYRHFLMVQLPCFVRSSTAALTMLGLPPVATMTNENDDDIRASNTISDNIEGSATAKSENNATVVNSSVSALVNSSKSLQFRFINDGDPFRHELQTHPHQQGPVARNGLLLRMRKNKRTGEVSSTVVGGVSKGFSFDQPADYHFLPSNTGIVPMAASGGGTGSSQPDQDVVLETLPVSFCRSYVNKVQWLSMSEGMLLPYEKSSSASSNKRSHPIETNVDDPVAIDGEEGGEREGEGEGEAEDVENYNMKRRRMRFITTPFIGFGGAVRFENPRGPVPTRWKNCPPTHKGIQMIALLKSIFEVIPILSKSQLISMLDIHGHVFLFNDCLPFAAYSYTNGPFKGLWVRYGYDPTALENSDSRIYQVINFRISTVILHDLTKKALDYIGRDRSHNKYIDLDKMIVRNLPTTSQEYRAKPTYGHLPACIFGHMIKYMFSIQIYSFTDFDMVECARAAAISNECSKISGWFLPHSLDGLRNLVLKIIAARFERFFSSPVVFEEDELKELDSNHNTEASALSNRQQMLNHGDIILSRDAEQSSISYMHNMSSCKAFPSINAVPITMLKSFLEKDFTSLLEDGSWDSARLFELVSSVAMDELGLPSSNIIVWLKIYRLLITMDVRALRSRRITMTEENKVEEARGDRPEPRRSVKQKKTAEQESSSSNNNASGIFVQDVSGSLLQPSEEIESSSLDAILTYGISYDSGISDMLLRQPSSQSQSSQQYIRQHHQQGGVSQVGNSSGSSSSSNRQSSLMIDFSNVQGYAVFGDDDDEDDDDEDNYGAGDDDDADNAYDDEYDE